MPYCELKWEILVQYTDKGSSIMTVFRKDITKREKIEVPGVIIDRSPDFARVYIGSPSIATIPDASYVASHDWFGPGTSNNRTAVFGSSNRGKT